MIEFQLFLGGPKYFFIFFNTTEYCIIIRILKITLKNTLLSKIPLKKSPSYLDVLDPPLPSADECSNTIDDENGEIV